MSKIDDLIQQYCPNGVEYRPLGEVFELRNGYTPSKNNPEYWDNGTIPWYRMEDIRENGRILQDSIQHITPAAVKGKGLFEANTFIIATTATIGEHALLIADSLANQQFTNLKIRESLKDKLDVKFVFYYLFVVDEFCKSHVNISGFASVDMEAFKRMPFPLPPMAVQEAIVNILDRFAEYTVELQAELQARQQQYHYYRDKLLSFEGREDVEYLAVPMFVELKAGVAIKAEGIRAQPDDDYKYPCFGGNGIRGYVGVYSHSGGYAIIGRQGALCGCVNWASADFYATEHAVVCKPLPNVHSRFIYHLFKNANLNQYKSQGAQPGLSVQRLNELVFPIPPLSEQQRIVDILDKFDTLVNDLSMGLPAEIEARRQQYEYYRDRLLTFKRKE